MSGQPELKLHHRVRVLQTRLVVSVKSIGLREESADVSTSEAALADNRRDRLTNPQITEKKLFFSDSAELASLS
jgi:hypothetical protein